MTLTIMAPAEAGLDGNGDCCGEGVWRVYLYFSSLEPVGKQAPGALVPFQSAISNALAVLPCQDGHL
jgi:hypothetical protein